MLRVTKYVLMLLAGAVLPAFAADITGHWSFDGDVEGNPVKHECDFKQDGAQLSGTCKSTERDPWTIAGKVDGSKVTFSYDAEHEGEKYNLVYTGTLDGDSTLKGEIEVAGVTGDFTAKKQ